MRISSGGEANSTTVNSSGYMSIDSGGVVNHTTVNHGGNMYISNGGVANSTMVNYAGSVGQFVNYGSNAVFIEKIADGKIVGAVNNLTFYGILYLGSSGMANNTAVNHGCSMYISNGGWRTIPQ